MAKVFIHAAGADKGGAVRHITNFLPHLGQADPGNEYTVLVRDTLPELPAASNVTVERLPRTQAGAWAGRLYYDTVALPRRLAREAYSGVVSLTNFGPVAAPVPHVFFQRNAKYYYGDFVRQAGLPSKVETLLRRRLAVASIMRAEIVVTPSRSMADLIQEVCPETRARQFRVLYHGFERSTPPPLDAKYRDIVERATGARLFYPTHPAPYKGFEVLFDAMGELKSRGVAFTLFLTIQRSDAPELIAAYERRIARLGLQSNVVFLGRVPQDQIIGLYTLCDLMVYPSLCESFGFSMVEAMGHGLPIVAAQTPINREICGAAALYYPALDPVKAADCVEEALQPSTHAELRGRAQAQLGRFDWSWARYAREFAGLVNGVTRDR